MSELKNTPWVIEVDPDGTCDIYVTDKKRESGIRWIAETIDEPTAKAIAALPDTLKELEAVKAELEKVRDESYQSAIRESGTSEQLKNMTKAWQQAQAERDELREEKNEFIRALKDCIDVLEQVRAERDELKAALKPFQDYPDDFSKEAPKDKFTMTVFCSDIAKAQELLKAK